MRIMRIVLVAAFSFSLGMRLFRAAGRRNGCHLHVRRSAVTSARSYMQGYSMSGTSMAHTTIPSTPIPHSLVPASADSASSHTEYLYTPFNYNHDPDRALGHTDTPVPHLTIPSFSIPQ